MWKEKFFGGLSDYDMSSFIFEINMIYTNIILEIH